MDSLLKRLEKNQAEQKAKKEEERELKYEIKMEKQRNDEEFFAALGAATAKYLEINKDVELGAKLESREYGTVGTGNRIIEGLSLRKLRKNQQEGTPEYEELQARMKENQAPYTH